VLANYAGFRALTASLYGVAEARYEEPAITFHRRRRRWRHCTAGRLMAYYLTISDATAALRARDVSATCFP
jgi:hypothetical protein